MPISLPVCQRQRLHLTFEHVPVACTANGVAEGVWKEVAICTQVSAHPTPLLLLQLAHVLDSFELQLPVVHTHTHPRGETSEFYS